MLLLYCSIAFKRPQRFNFLQLQQKRGMKAYIQVVGQHTADGPPSIILHYDTQRYIFNVREGTQRLCVQEKVKLAKANQIFLTQTNWDCLGGLTGLLLTLTDAGLKKIHLHGGKNLTHFVAATRRFAYRNTSTVQVNELNEESVYKDSYVTIKPVITSPFAQGQKRSFEEKESMEEETAVDSTLETPTKKNPYELHDKIRQMKGPEADAYRKSVVDAMYSDRSATAINADCTPRDQHPLRKGSSLGLPLPTTSPDLSAISYICQGVTLPGKFNKNAAIALGIRPGPLYGRLHKGESVTLEDGRVVTPDMVCEPAKPGHLFLLIDCPSLEHMDSLVLSDQFKDYQAGGANQPNVIFHFVDRQVLEAEKYKTWLARFGKETEHVFSAIDLCPQDVQFTSHALCQVKLAKLNDEIFRVPYYQNQAELALEDVEGLPEKSFALKSLATYSLEPKREWQYLDRPAFDHTNMELEEIKAVENNKEYLEAAALAREEASQVDISGQFPGDDVQVITLGTGSSIPAKYRNVSATMVKIPEHGTIMLDAGEGTYGQMMRRFDREEVNEEMKKLVCIFVSHLHADHHLGVIQLIRKWSTIAPYHAQLAVVAPRVYRYWLDEYFQVESMGPRRRIQFINSESLLPGADIHPAQALALKSMKQKLGLKEIRPVEVVHCKWAYGLSIEHKNGLKLVYSGDTRPSENLIKEGQNATLLIHEATFDDTEKQNAIDKRHTTTGEAIDVGKRMNARYTLLNHFSQRYPKIPHLSEEQSNVCFSFDLMSTLIKQIPVLPKYTNAMRLIFKESEDPEDEQVVIK